MLKASKSVKTLEIRGARTYFVIVFSGEMVNLDLLLFCCGNLLNIPLQYNGKRKQVGITWLLWQQKWILIFQ